MRYIISIILSSLVFAIFTLTSQLAGAASTVSGEVKLPPKVVTGTVTNKDTNRQTKMKIAKVKKEIATLAIEIKYVEQKKATQAKRKLDTSTFEKKLVELRAKKKKLEDSLTSLEKSLGK